MTAPTTTSPRGADTTRIPPPLLFAAPFLFGLAAQQVEPLPFGHRHVTEPLGAAALASGLLLVGWALAAVHRAGTTVVPHHPVTVLLTSGPYALSRNPMYTGLAVAMAGGALLADSWWPLALLPLSATLVSHLAIRPEERYLATGFGDSYTGYCSTVRRWI
ncbi:MAG: icmt [Frankiales bacterium]|nr:icmt [Frankiales bacterium]